MAGPQWRLGVDERRLLAQIRGPSLHRQAATAEHPARQIVHLVAFHAWRTFQPIPHADQSWTTSGLWFKLRADQAPSRIYLPPGGQALAGRVGGGYLHVELPPASTHTVVVIDP